AGERRGDGALDALDRAGLEGERPGGRIEGRRGLGFGALVEPNGERIGAGDAERRGRVVPADEDRLAAGPGHRRFDDRGDAQVEPASSIDGNVHRVAEATA